MKQEEVTKKIETIIIDAEISISLRNALFAAIYCQDVYSIKNFEWAFVLLGKLLSNVVNELKDILENFCDDN